MPLQPGTIFIDDLFPAFTDFIDAYILHRIIPKIVTRTKNGFHPQFYIYSWFIKLFFLLHSGFKSLVVAYTANVLTIKTMDFDHVPIPGIMSP